MNCITIHSNKPFDKLIAYILGIAGLVLHVLGIVLSTIFDRINNHIVSYTSCTIVSYLTGVGVFVLFLSLCCIHKKYSIFSYLMSLISGFISFPIIFIVTGNINSGFDHYFYILAIYYGFSCNNFKKLFAIIPNQILINFLFHLAFIQGLPPYHETTVSMIPYVVSFNISWIIILILSNILYRALLIESCKYRQLAAKDELTSLYNRRRLDNDLLNHNFHYGIMMDIDYFKEINDTYGHQAGDEALRTLSRMILKRTSNEFIAYRYGGEEFFAVSRYSYDETIRIIKDIYNDIQKNFRILDKPITVSFGISEFLEDTAIDQFVNEADAQMYLSKHNGKNRVTFNCRELDMTN